MTAHATIRWSRVGGAAVTGTLLLGGLAMAASVVGARRQPTAPGFDYRTVPPPHAEVEADLRTRGVGIMEAIALSLEETGGGVVASAGYVRRAAPLDAIAVVVYHGDGAKTRLTLDADTGTVVERAELTRLPGAPVTGEPVAGPDGVSWYVLAEGDGETPDAPGANVRIEYTGWLLDGTQFDSTDDFGRPVTLPLSAFLPGWARGMQDMRAGERRKLIIPPEGAFGGMGNPPTIPPDATLVIDVALLAVVDYVNVPDVLPGWPVDGPGEASPSGLRWWDVEAGDPAAQAIPNLDTIVDLHITGYLTDGTVFLRTRDEEGRGTPQRLDLRRWLTGGSEGVLGLRAGARRKLVLPARLAYGSTGRRQVPPSATVILDIEVVGMPDR